MRIGINIDAQFVPMTGIQHCTDSLIGALYELQTPHDIHAFAGNLPHSTAVEDAVEKNPGTFAWRELPQADLDVYNPAPTLMPKNFHKDHPWIAGKLRRHEERALRRLVVGPIGRSEAYDVLHTPEAFDMRCRSYRPKHSVATIYDATAFLFPELYPPTIRIDFWMDFYRWAEQHCDGIIAISESTKQDIVEHLKIPADRIFTIPIAGRKSTRRVEDGEERRAVLHKWNLDTRPFVLYTGTLEPRKNLERLIRAFAVMIKQEPTLPHKLVLAGGKWERMDLELRLLACEQGIPGRIATTGYVTNDELNALMSACDAFAYVSLYEGFGMPPLEAMTCGAPVVVSNNSSLPEVVGDAGILVPPKDEEVIAHAIYRLLTDSEENARRRRLSVARAAEFSWRRTAEQTMRVYEAAASA